MTPRDAILKVKVIGRYEADEKYASSIVELENDLKVTLPNSLIHFEKKVVIPQFVANWIESCKRKRWTLYLSMSEAGKNEDKVCEWIFGLGDYDHNNQETFALAWVNGYEVEQEKRYLVKIKGEVEENLLVYGLGIKRYFFARTYDSSKRNGHTRKELEEDGFGWVFDCPGVEVEEAEP